MIVMCLSPTSRYAAATASAHGLRSRKLARHNPGIEREPGMIVNVPIKGQVPELCTAIREILVGQEA